MNPPICSVCSRRDAASYFKVARIAQDGTESPLTTTCSLRCLTSWTCHVMTMQGARVAYGVKEMIGKIVGMFG